jgi:hypothetical protein
MLSVTLTRPQRIAFGGRVLPDVVAFDFPWFDGEAPSFVDVLSPTRTVVIDGTAYAPFTKTILSGTFCGGFRVFESTPVSGQTPVAWCLSDAHRFVMAR